MLPHRWSRFLPSFTSSSPPPYGFLALSASSPPSPELGNPNDKPFFRRGSTRLPFLLQLWLYVSPLIVLALCALLWGRKDLSKLDLLNPYVCKTKSLYASLASICEDEPQRPGYGDEVEKFELGIDRHLTSAQCDAVFPGLYLEADRARDYYKARGGINFTDLDAAQVKGQGRAKIINNRLYVTYFAKEQQGTRTIATLAAINEALITSLEPLPDVEFVLQTGDTGFVNGAPWVLGRKAAQEGLVLMPDYGFYSWPEPGVGSFLEVQDKTLLYETNLAWKDKIPQLFWRGALMVDLRKEFWEIARKYQWGAVSDLDWLDKDIVQSELLTPEQHCKYKFLGHVEGWAYSGRLKYLQQCRSVVVAHKMQYLQHFHHLFNSDPTSPDQNIVITPGNNFDELPETMAALLADDARAEQIADNSFKFYRHWLSPASVDCYWRRLIVRWAEVQNFEPVLEQDTVSFNSFSLLGKTHWVPY